MEYIVSRNNGVISVRNSYGKVAEFHDDEAFDLFLIGIHDNNEKFARLLTITVWDENQAKYL